MGFDAAALMRNDAKTATPVPKTRDERLRDFYAQHSTALEESTPWQLQQTEVKESQELRKKGNDLFEAQDYEAAVEHYTAAIKNHVDLVSWSVWFWCFLTFGGRLWHNHKMTWISAHSAKERRNISAPLEPCSSIYDAGLVATGVEGLQPSQISDFLKCFLRRWLNWSQPCRFVEKLIVSHCGIGFPVKQGSGPCFLYI